jgi:hypothetical protein
MLGLAGLSALKLAHGVLGPKILTPIMDILNKVWAVQREHWPCVNSRSCVRWPGVRRNDDDCPAPQVTLGKTPKFSDALPGNSRFSGPPSVPARYDAPTVCSGAMALCAVLDHYIPGALTCGPPFKLQGVRGCGM